MSDEMQATDRGFRVGRWLMLGLVWVALGGIDVHADALSPPMLQAPETRLTEPHVKPGVFGLLFTPKGDQPAPAVVILHGRSGIFPDYRQLARRLAEQGYVALVLDYYAERGGVPPRSESLRKKKWPDFERAVQQSIRYLGKRADVDADRIGLLGLSQGAMLAVSTAGITPEVKAVVTYYPRTPWSFDEIAANLPPLLILHGQADPWHKAAKAQQMHDDLAQLGKTVEIKIYPETSHGFNVLSRFYQPQAAADAEQRAFSFLAQYLKPVSGPGGVAAPETFEAAITHFYSVDLPREMSVPGGSVERLFELPIFMAERYVYTNEYQQTSDYATRRKALSNFYRKLLERGVHRQPVYKIEAIERLDPTHGAVTYTAITNQIHIHTHSNRLTLQSGISHWEKVGGQWRMVSDRVGSPYRATARLNP